MILRFNIGLYLKDYRVTKKSVADILGISRQTFNYHIRKGMISTDYLQAISMVIHKSVPEIYVELTKNYVLIL